MLLFEYYYYIQYAVIKFSMKIGFVHSLILGPIASQQQGKAHAPETHLIVSLLITTKTCKNLRAERKTRFHVAEWHRTERERALCDNI